VNVAAQAVEFCHADSAATTTRFCERSGELWATVEGVSAFACLDFHELTDDLEALRGRETRKGLALCLQAEARTPLLRSGHAAIRDDWPCHNSLGSAHDRLVQKIALTAIVGQADNSTQRVAGAGGDGGRKTVRGGIANAKTIGWAIYAAGFAIWLFGYLSAGHAPLFDWKAATPWWISSFVPNLEAELGLLLQR
jgi:hypothetical protein